MQRKSRPPAAGAAKPPVVKAPAKKAPAKRPARPRTPPPAVPVPVSRQEDLERMRERLLAAMDLVDAKDLPRVCAELRAVDTELAALVPTKTPGQELVDELKARRAGRTAS